MGSRSTQKTEIPAYMQEAGEFALQRAKEISELGRLPYMGPEVAAINPAEAALARNVGGMASAFGLEAPAALDMSGMPTVTQGGMTGYTSYPAFIESMERLRAERPDQYDYFARMGGFDPITGARIAPAAVPAAAPVAARPSYSSNNDDGGPSHAEIMAMHYGTTPNSLTTGGPSAASQAVFSQADLMGNHGGSYTSKITSDIGKFASGGGLFGAIKNAFSKNDDPSIGNVP